MYRPPWRHGRGAVPRLLVQPTLRFMRIEAAGGIVIVLAALAALIWANVAPGSYEGFWSSEIVLNFDIHTLEMKHGLQGLVNDGLMVIFFFVIGLEIKREMVHGELADRRQAALPVFAALGGMIVPALVFLAFNLGGDGSRGWGIPVATDIAFALGVLALVGPRVPAQLKIFLLALAVADDIGGILIIAFVYTDDLKFGWLGAALALLGLIVVMRRSGVRAVPAYVVVGWFVWLATFESGVHATIAGVVLGLMTPVGALYVRQKLPAALRLRVDQLDEALAIEAPAVREDEAEEAIRHAEELSRESRSPLERIERAVTPWSAFVVIPIFALANAGIQLSGDSLEAAVKSEIAWGVVAGLLLGKFAGILSFSWLSVAFGVAIKSAAISWRDIAGVALLAGVGFTVAIFIATLSFDQPALVEEAKIGILTASIVAAVLGYAVLRLELSSKPSDPDEKPPDGPAEAAPPSRVESAPGEH